MNRRVDAAPRRTALMRTLLWSAAVACSAGAVADEAAPVAAAPAATSPSAAAPPSAWRDPVDLPAEIQPQAEHSLLLDMVEAGTVAIAVGERGTVLTSTDRSHWEQVAGVPTRATLTAVAAVGNKAWAVGHDGVILASSDAGQHWTLQRKDP